MKRRASWAFPWFVALQIMAVSTRASNAQSPRPADLIPRDDSSFDANGFPLNPIWGWQKLGRSSADLDQLCGFVAGLGQRSERPLLLRHASCTSQKNLIILNERQAGAPAGYACNQDTDEGELQGHVNWFVVSAVGAISWESYARGNLGQDHDFTLWLDTLADLRASVDTRRRDRERPEIEIEFSGDEVLGWASDSLPPWWKILWRAAQDGDAVPDSIIGFMPAAITGVFGLDAIHGAHPELHPVYALALLARQTPEGADGIREHWAFFLRNGGKEGECSNGLLPFQDLPSDAAGRLVFRFTVPWRAGAREVAAQWPAGASGVISSTGAVEGPLLRQQPSRGAQMTFAIPKPTRGGDPAVIIGEFDLVWRGVRVEPPAKIFASAPRRRARKRELEPGEKFGANLKGELNSKQAAALRTLLAQGDSNTYAPRVSTPGGVLVPRHDESLAAARLVHAAPRDPAPVAVWRPHGYEPSPPPLPCKNAIPGCVSTGRSGVAAGISSPGGGRVLRLILFETKAYPVQLPFGPVPLIGLRFALGVDQVHPPVSQAPGGVTLVNPSAALVLRLPSLQFVGPYLLGGVDGYLGSEGGLGGSVGGGVRLRTGLPALVFLEGRRALRFNRIGYWAWEGGLVAPLF